eukprot:15484054-Alexandrium_andersonii.AAC.1
MRRRSNQWFSASSKSAGPTRDAARARPSSGRGSRSGRCGAANSRPRVAASWRRTRRPAASTSCRRTISGE